MSQIWSSFKTFCHTKGFGKVFDKKNSSTNDVKEDIMEENQNTEEIKNEQQAENTEATQDTEATAQTAEATEQETDGPKEPTAEDKIAELEEKIKAMHNDYVRLYADFENYKKHAIKEKSEILQTAGKNVLVDIIPMCDNLERAITVVQTATDIEPVKEGINLIYTMFSKFLADHNMKPIETEGKEFNTDFHEAIATIPAPSEDMKNKIIDCTQKGYMIGDKVVRFAKVVIGQ